MGVFLAVLSFHWVVASSADNITRTLLWVWAIFLGVPSMDFARRFRIRREASGRVG
jgi:hypothetical protein